MSTLHYRVPDRIKGKCDQAKYSRWPHRKALAHARRGRKRSRACAIARYQAEIHASVCSSGDVDFYTGQPLDWSLVRTYNNESLKDGRRAYKSTLALLPTIDHTVDESGQPRFVIWSWQVNDAKRI